MWANISGRPPLLAPEGFPRLVSRREASPAAETIEI